MNALNAMNALPSTIARTAHALLLAAALAAPSEAQVRIPADFESPGTALDPMFSYFGGVQGFGVELSPTSIFSGASLRVWANFRPDPIFRSAGVGVGALLIPRPALSVPPDAAFFSITVRTPPTAGRFALKANFIEDDNNDGVLDEVEADDQWKSPLSSLPRATTVINVAFADLIDANPLVGNDTLNITTTPRIALTLTLETKTTYPGGIVTTPQQFFIDHVGFYSAPQSIPTPCPADFNGAGGVTVQDVFDFLLAWFTADPRADFNHAGGVTVQDIFDFVAAWFQGC